MTKNALKILEPRDQALRTKTLTERSEKYPIVEVNGLTAMNGAANIVALLSGGREFFPVFMLDSKGKPFVENANILSVLREDYSEEEVYLLLTQWDSSLGLTPADKYHEKQFRASYLAHLLSESGKH